MPRASKVTKHRNGAWDAVPVRTYKDDAGDHKGVTRRELIGAAQDEQASGFVVRYFEIAPGGFSSLERHEHAHAVWIVRGNGTVVLEDGVSSIGPQDCVYVAPGALHQFQASDSEPLGFLGIVDRGRARPQPPSREEVEILLARGVSVKPRRDQR